MKILCISDHVDPLIYSLNIKERFADVDIVISAGDLSFSYYDFIVSLLNKPLLFVFGNHQLEYLNKFRRSRDPYQADESWSGNRRQYGGALHIDRHFTAVKGLLIVGLGGCLWYNGGDNQFTDFAMWRRVIGLVPRLIWNKLRHGRYLDILVTHAAALNLGDLPDRCHRGFKAFRWLISKYQPRYHIHGHIHLYDQGSPRKHRLGSTIVLNAYNHTVIDIKEPEGGRGQPENPSRSLDSKGKTENPEASP